MIAFDWLLQKSGNTRCLRAREHFRAGAAGYENDGRHDFPPSQNVNQFEPCHAGHMHVQNKTVLRIQVARCKQIRWRAIILNRKTMGFQKKAKCASNAVIVIDQTYLMSHLNAKLDKGQLDEHPSSLTILIGQGWGKGFDIDQCYIFYKKAQLGNGVKHLCRKANYPWKGVDAAPAPRAAIAFS